MFSFLIRSNYFEVVTSFKPFNSTGAISFSGNHFNGVSFEWALTHRSFPRILPDSSNYSGAIPKFFSKCDVRMNFHQSHAFSKVVFNFFSSSLAQPFLLILPEYLNNSWWFSSSFSTFEDRRRISPKSWSVLLKFVVLA